MLLQAPMQVVETADEKLPRDDHRLPVPFKEVKSEEGVGDGIKEGFFLLVDGDQVHPLSVKKSRKSLRARRSIWCRIMLRAALGKSTA